MIIGKSVKKTVLGLSAVALLALPLVTFGQVTGNLDSGSELLELINTIANWFAAVLFVVAVIFIILAAFGYLTAGGDEEKVGKAKKQLVYAVIALVIGALAFFIPNIIQDILGIEVETVSPDTGF